MHDVPRQLTVEELAELFEGRTRLVEKLAEQEDPLGAARDVIGQLKERDKLEALNAHPAIGAKRLSARSAAEQGGDADPVVLTELAYLNQVYEEKFGCTPVEYVEELGWLAEDVWCAHCVHLSAQDVAKFGEHDVGVAHCPSSNMRLGAGMAPVRELLDAGARVGLGVDGSASNERGDLFLEVKQALLVARARGGPKALTAREALRLGTRGSAAVLGRDDIGRLSPGKRADFAVWRTDGLELGGASDPVAGLVFAGPHRVDRLYVAGEEVVRDGRLVRGDEDEIAREQRRQAERFAA